MKTNSTSLINEMSSEFPSKSANEAFARTSVAAFAAQLDPTLDELNDIKTAVSEAVTNCIVHAYPDNIGKIKIHTRLFAGNLLEIIIKDRGMGFTIMESFMDNLKIKSSPGKGTVLTMRKKISVRISGRS